jgi:hypothetical protein
MFHEQPHFGKAEARDTFRKPNRIPAPALRRGDRLLQGTRGAPPLPRS